MKQRIKQYILILVSCLMAGSLVVANTTPMTISLQATLQTQKTNLNAEVADIKVELEGKKIRPEDGKSVLITTWSQKYKQEMIRNGRFSVVLGTDPKNPIKAEMLNLQEPHFRITLNDRDDLTARFPVPSVPYSIQSKVAEEVLSVKAENIHGVFTNPFLVKADMNINSNTLVVKKNGNVGVNTATPNYMLDVNGNLNASEYYYTDKSGKQLKLEEALSWRKSADNQSLYYVSGNVGIATENPKYALDVVGTVNATQYLIKGEPLNDWLSGSLSWRKTKADSIYYKIETSDGGVGIGTDNISERLDVDGAIRIGNSIQKLPKAGTIEYSLDSKGLPDFYGYVRDGIRFSLTGLKPENDPQKNQILFYTNKDRVSGSDQLTFVNERLGVGTPTPDATVTIVGSPDQNEDLLNIKNSDGKTVLNVKDKNVGIGTDDPKFKLDVNGILNTQEYYINGEPLNKAFSTGTFFLKGNNEAVFYDLGNVGIGTSTPKNLLEISSPTRNAAITFDILGDDLFTIGVDSLIENTFIFSKGSDLSQPVFSFNGERIGVGLNQPKSNLHVSGNSGLLVEGTFGDPNAFLPATGAGTRMIWYPGKSAFRVGHVEGSNWNDVNLGLHSVGLGYDPLVTGEYAVVAGGYKNQAIGKNSFVAGGLTNIAEGHYSFAAGHNAYAKHHGSFVWADYTPTANPFESTAPNQFLIRANGGVGIGTNKTDKSVLTVYRDNDKSHRLITLGNVNNPDNVTVVNAEGQLGIGVSKIPDNTKMTVMGGNVGIGTTMPKAMLTISSNLTEGNILEIKNENVSSDPLVVISHEGNMGVGVRDPQYALDLGAGKIYASQFLMVDPNDPSSVIVLQPSNGSPWADPSENGNNTYRAQGLIGIGTATPNSLLELSNQNSKGSPPVITFDLNKNDIYSIGVVTDNNNIKYFTIQPGSSLSQKIAPILIATQSVGIGTTVNPPSSNLHVSGNTTIIGSLLVGTTNVKPGYEIFIDGTLRGMNLGDNFVINDDKWDPKPTPWKTNKKTDEIYYTSGNVGIGTAFPTATLDVNGTVSVNRFEVKSPIKLDGDLTTKLLKLKDIKQTVATYGMLFVEDTELKYRKPGSNEDKIISSPIKKEDGLFSGPLSYWIDESTIGIAPIFWNNDKGILSASSNLRVNGYIQEELGLTITSNTEFGIPSYNQSISSFRIDSELTHRGKITEVTSYTGQDINIVFKKDWGTDTEEPVIIKGLDLNLSQQGGKVLNRSKVIGLNVDVSSVNIESNSNKYAALFMGGNVGIGTESPLTELEVNGVVSANFFNLTGGLDVSTLTINKENKGFYAETSRSNQTRIGIGTLTPETELDVHGTVSTNRLIVRSGLVATTMNIGNNNFVVDDAGNIGVGTDKPNAFLELSKEITKPLDKPYIGEKIGINIARAKEKGDSFKLLEDLTGLQVNMSSEKNNKLGGQKVATAIKVDLSNIQLDKDSKAVGLDINVESPETDNPGAIRYAALFNGGKVGIGTREPLATLHVSGNLRANKIILGESIDTPFATFNSLVVQGVASFNRVTLNELVINDRISANRLTIQKGIEAPFGEFSQLTAKIASFNTIKANNLTVSNNLSSLFGEFSGGIGIGGVQAPTSGILVSGNISAGDLVVNNNLIISKNATFRVNNSDLYVDKSGLVGLGTINPKNKLHVYFDKSVEYDEENSNSWNAIRVESNVNQNEGAAGILLVPNNSAPSSSIGSGIVAVRGNPDINASDLVFITDPIEGLPKERIRITSEGKIGIGLKTPQHELDIAGTTRVSGNLIIDGQLIVKEIKSNGSLVISPNQEIIFKEFATFEKPVTLNKGLYFQINNTVPPVSKFGQIYLDKNQDLIYQIPGETNTKNISSAFTGKSSVIPYFDKNGNLSSQASLTYSTETNKTTIGDKDNLGQLEIINNFNKDNEGNMSAVSINMQFKDRTAATQKGTFKGLNIDFRSDPLPGEDPLLFGRLGDQEVAIGLNIDLRNLIADYSINNKNTSATKYSALFQGGNVGIETETPQAALHIVSDGQKDAFRVDTKDKLNTLIVNKDGLVGIGTGSPESMLHIENTQDKAFAMIVSSNSKTVLAVLKNGNVGIGTDSPSEKLEVSGTVSANIANVGTLVGTTLNIANGALVVSNNIVGIGTLNPKGNIQFKKELTSNSEESPFISQKMELVIAGDPAKEQGGFFKLQRDLTGINIDIDTNTGSSIGDNTVGVTVNGMVIDLTGITLSSDKSNATGLNVDVTGEEGNRYAALFLGGNVGIGLKTPTQDLVVSGNIKAKNIIIEDHLDASIAIVTANTLKVLDKATFKTVTINSLVADLVSANKITIKEELTVSTASFTEITANLLAAFNKVGVGIADPTVELDVSGSVKVSGNIIIQKELMVHSITANNKIITINANELFISGKVSVNNTLSIKEHMFLTKGITRDLTERSRTQLFVDSDGHLNYALPDTTIATINITKPLSGTPGQIPFYGDNGLVTGNPNFTYDNSNNKVTLGIANQATSLFINSTFDKDLTDNEISAQTIFFDIADRSGFDDKDQTFKGLNIKLQSNPLETNDPFNFGRLSDKEVAIGVHVDMTNVSAKYTSSQKNPSAYKGTKYAALFSGGNVGIGPDATFKPNATLHIKSSNDSEDIFRIDSSNQDSALHVNGLGLVGLNQSNPQAQLHIQKQLNATRPLLKITSDNETADFLIVDQKGFVGIASSNPTSILTVSGDIKINNSKNEKVLATNQGNIGIGTETPEALLEITRAIANSESYFKIKNDSKTNFVVNKSSDGVNVGVGLDSPNYNLSVDGLIQATDGQSTLLPSFVNDSKSRGFIVENQQSFLFYGINGESSTPEPSIVWGPDNSTKLTFRYSDNNDNFSDTKSILTLVPETLSEGSRVGIATSNPLATLGVSGNVVVMTADGSVKAMIVTKNSQGNSIISIGGNPSIQDLNQQTASLNINGDLKTNSISIVKGNVELSTVNITGELVVSRKVDEATVDYKYPQQTSGQTISINIAEELSHNVTGLDINITAADNIAANRKYTIWNNNVAYGLKVDVSSLLYEDASLANIEDFEIYPKNRNGNKYAAAFLGGNVGIGVNEPKFPLHVKSNVRGNIAQFSATNTDLLIKDYDNGSIGFNLINAKEPGIENRAILLQPTRVGIGTTPTQMSDGNPETRLLVNGDIRVGINNINIRGTAASGTATPEITALNIGNRLFFSGGTHTSSASNSDNNDPIWIARYNEATNKSSLLVNVGGYADTADSTKKENDKFIIGYPKGTGGEFQNAFVVQMDGKVGIGPNNNAMNPKTWLHVKGDSQGPADKPENSVVLIENTSGNGNALALSTISDQGHLATFYSAGTLVGSIKANKDSVRYQTIGADYAEYLPKINQEEVISKGQIVGVVNGKISKDTSNAQLYLVKSTSPAVAGNWPGEDKTGFELIAFFGQVEVEVLGSVNEGDYIIPSGKNDGIGIAKPESMLSAIEKQKIVGRAWESSDNKNIKKINVAVGMNFSRPSIQSDINQLTKLEDKLIQLELDKQTIQEDLNSRLNSQDNELKMLLNKVDKLSSN
ncbi:hypothetical protein DID75_00425 [Candidatus Marinamargulisbacteria bacterium SCGC AG-410-N11]|nr:hypothetical protein DID75_00425 [Candidatus Marinamargulisbacteria bacterium SCGC AG-410-N11]